MTVLKGNSEIELEDSGKRQEEGRKKTVMRSARISLSWDTLVRTLGARMVVLNFRTLNDQIR